MGIRILIFYWFYFIVCLRMIISRFHIIIFESKTISIVYSLHCKDYITDPNNENCITTAISVLFHLCSSPYLIRHYIVFHISIIWKQKRLEFVSFSARKKKCRHYFNAFCLKYISEGLNSNVYICKKFHSHCHMQIDKFRSSSDNNWLSLSSIILVIFRPLNKIHKKNRL